MPRVTELGTRWFLYHTETKVVDGQRVDAKVIVDPFKDKELSERVYLCLNAFMDVPLETLRELAAKKAKTHNDVVAVFNHSMSKTKVRVLREQTKRVRVVPVRRREE